LVIVLAVLFFAAPVAAENAAVNPIPELALKQVIARQFPSWNMARCITCKGAVSLFTLPYYQRLRSSFSDNTIWEEVPCRVNGDFDGDGMLDTAVQLKRRDGSSQRTIVVVIFQRQGALLPVYAGEGDDTLGIAKKGTIDRDYAGEGSIRYKNDAIYVGHDESGSVSLVFKDGRFLVFITGD
jgi:hypothetical protein